MKWALLTLPLYIFIGLNAKNRDTQFSFVLKKVDKLHSLILKMGFCCSYFYYLINPGKIAHSDDDVRLQPISHQCVMCLCTWYEAGLTCMKWQKADFHFETKSIGQVKNAFSYHINWSL